MEDIISTTDQILTTDGLPLKVSLRKTERKNKIRALLLVFPLLLFIIVTFVVPIGDMLLRSVDDSQINNVYSKTFEEYNKWDSENDELPPEAVYEAIFNDIHYYEIDQDVAVSVENYILAWQSVKNNFWDFHNFLII